MMFTHFLEIGKHWGLLRFGNEIQEVFRRRLQDLGASTTEQETEKFKLKICAIVFYFRLINWMVYV